MTVVLKKDHAVKNSGYATAARAAIPGTSRTLDGCSISWTAKRELSSFLLLLLLILLEKYERGVVDLQKQIR
jgi:hypothetical protein